MAARKRPTPRRRTTTATKRRNSSAKRRNGGKIIQIIIPALFIGAILVALGFMVSIGYRTVTASSFFDVKEIDIRGVYRASESDIENIVKRNSSNTGAWNADLPLIKNEIEKLTFVKSAVVSRVLPGGLRINVVERIPRAVVSLESGEIWVDEEAVSLGRVGNTDERPPFVLKGWDEQKTLRSLDENKQRVKTYLEMLREWHDFDLAKRVVEVDLRDLDETQVFVKDSGETVKITIGNGNYGKRLREALKAIANKGKEIKSFDVENSVAQPRENK